MGHHFSQPSIGRSPSPSLGAILTFRIIRFGVYALSLAHIHPHQLTFVPFALLFLLINRIAYDTRDTHGILAQYIHSRHLCPDQRKEIAYRNARGKLG